MHHFFVESEQIQGQNVSIIGKDVNHIRNVLRMKAGQEIQIRTQDGSGNFRCQISEIGEEEILAEIMWKDDQDTELSSHLVLYQGLPKGDKMEWIIQKAVELGADRIVPVDMKRCVMRLPGERAKKKVAKWQAVSESAAKQSRRMIVPEVSAVLSWKEALADAAKLDVRLVPYELAEGIEKTRQILGEIKPGSSVGIFIGPEGGIDPSEIEAALTQGAETITLGRRILRTETAGMTVLAALMMQLEE